MSVIFQPFNTARRGGAVRKQGSNGSSQDVDAGRLKAMNFIANKMQNSMYSEFPDSLVCLQDLIVHSYQATNRVSNGTNDAIVEMKRLTEAGGLKAQIESLTPDDPIPNVSISGERAQSAEGASKAVHFINEELQKMGLARHTGSTTVFRRLDAAARCGKDYVNTFCEAFCDNTSIYFSGVPYGAARDDDLIKVITKSVIMLGAARGLLRRGALECTVAVKDAERQNTQKTFDAMYKEMIEFDTDSYDTCKHLKGMFMKISENVETEEVNTLGWEAYVVSVDHFRKNTQMQLLETNKRWERQLCHDVYDLLMTMQSAILTVFCDPDDREKTAQICTQIYKKEVTKAGLDFLNQIRKGINQKLASLRRGLTRTRQVDLDRTENSKFDQFFQEMLEDTKNDTLSEKLAGLGPKRDRSRNISKMTYGELDSFVGSKGAGTSSFKAKNPQGAAALSNYQSHKEAVTEIMQPPSEMSSGAQKFGTEVPSSSLSSKEDMQQALPTRRDLPPRVVRLTKEALVQFETNTSGYKPSSSIAESAKSGVSVQSANYSAMVSAKEAKLSDSTQLFFMRHQSLVDDFVVNHLPVMCSIFAKDVNRPHTVRFSDHEKDQFTVDLGRFRGGMLKVFRSGIERMFNRFLANNSNELDASKAGKYDQTIQNMEINETFLNLFLSRSKRIIEKLQVKEEILREANSLMLAAYASDSQKPAVSGDHNDIETCHKCYDELQISYNRKFSVYITTFTDISRSVTTDDKTLGRMTTAIFPLPIQTFYDHYMARKREFELNQLNNSITEPPALNPIVAQRELQMRNAPSLTQTPQVSQPKIPSGPVVQGGGPGASFKNLLG